METCENAGRLIKLKINYINVITNVIKIIILLFTIIIPRRPFPKFKVDSTALALGCFGRASSRINGADFMLNYDVCVCVCVVSTGNR